GHGRGARAAAVVARWPGWGGPWPDAARLGDGPFQLLQVGVEVEERVVPDRPPRLAQLLPVGSGAGRGGLPVAERGGRAAQVAAPPGVGQRRPRRGGELRPCGRGRLGGPTGGGGSRPGSGRRHDGPVPARISARCTARTPLRSRDSAPPMWARQELSTAHTTSAPVSRMWRTLSATIATDTSAFFIANE